MAKKTTLIKWSFVLLVIIAILLVLSLTPANKSQPSVDYVAEYNRISKPADFDPNDNALPYFDKAFTVMLEEPNDIKTLYKIWPGDMNNEQLQAARQWLESNRQTIDYLKQAAQKPYYWKPLEADNNKPLMAAALSDLKNFRKTVYLLCLNAKLMANDGKIEPALRQLTDVYKIGIWLTGPKNLVEQLVGIAIAESAVQSAFQILDRTNPSLALLEDFQKQISYLASQRSFVADFTAERLMFHDMLDQLLAGYGQKKDASLFIKKIFLGSVGRAWAVRERRKADLMYGYFTAARLKKPWQLHNEGNDVYRVTEKMTKGTLYLRILAPAFNRALPMSYRPQVHTDALIAVIAILRYKADKGRYPQDLQVLVTNGYLEKLPIDAFSGNSLVYKLTTDNFVLYSFAQDFDDDGGKHDPKWADKGDGDYVFWPVQKTNLATDK